MSFNSDDYTINISEPICSVYVMLLRRVISSENFERPLEGTINEEIYSCFYEGLAANRLELRGHYYDLGGWLLLMAAGHLYPDEPEEPFEEGEWEALSANEKALFCENAERLSPPLASAWDELHSKWLLHNP
ncbi:MULTISPECIES: hypothetical protein [Pseudomonas]|uniref:hypothetical protein n=1 Tax=Pseudomonas TaxID=286 RepID=UPI001183888C|nr:hypothetical protein [Pseudomonas sp. BJP69]QDR68464.1 hypothetical protein FPB55_12830 [Pseudomonas sp. BJP69]WHL27061.1 hypothetical protein QJS63_21115 [Pseudomonas juntendi]